MIDKAFGIIPFHNDGSINNYLLIRHNRGHWAFPKGHKNDGETPLETACREFEEETGIREYTLIPDKSFIENYSYNLEGQLVEKTVEYFIAMVDKTASVKIQIEEIQEYKWCTFNEAVRLITFRECRELIVRVDEYIKDL